MKTKHVLTLSLIFILMSSAVSAGFFSDLFNLITGNAVGREGFYVEFQGNRDLSGTVTCNGEERAYMLKSYNDEMITLADTNAKAKEVYITKGSCKGIYYKDEETGKTISLNVQAANLIIGNRYYYLTIKESDLRSVYGDAYRSVQVMTLQSDDATMRLETGVSKTKLIYLYEEGVKSALLYQANSDTLMKAASVDEKIIFDSSPVLVPKKVEEPAAKPKAAAPAAPEEAAAWNEDRVASLETQVAELSQKVDQLALSVQQLGAGQKKGFWSRVFRG